MALLLKLCLRAQKINATKMHLQAPVYHVFATTVKGFFFLFFKLQNLVGLGHWSLPVEGLGSLNWPQCGGQAEVWDVLIVLCPLRQASYSKTRVCNKGVIKPLEVVDQYPAAKELWREKQQVLCDIERFKWNSAMLGLLFPWWMFLTWISLSLYSFLTIQNLILSVSCF